MSQLYLLKIKKQNYLKILKAHLNEKKIPLISSCFILLLIISIFSFSSDEYSKNTSVLKNLKEKYTIFAIPKPTSTIYFANERVPIENPDIWERYDKLLKNTY